MNRHGQWFSLPSLSAKILTYIGLDDFVWGYTQKSLYLMMDKFEKEAVHFPQPAGALHADYLVVSKYLLQKRKSVQLSRRSIALDYRLEGVNGGSSKEEPAKEATEAFVDEANKWKTSNKLFWCKPLTSQERDFVERAMGYPQFIQLVQEVPELKEKLFNWIIRDRLPPEVFVEFPVITNLINENLLNGRIGTLGGDKLRVQKWTEEHVKTKIVTLPFEGKEYSLLNPKLKITFRGGYSLSLEEIYKLFQDKPHRFVNIEYFAQGVTNWNGQHMGYWKEKDEKYSEIDLNQNKWWRQLPPLEIMTTDEAKERYGDFVNGINWIVAAKSARQNFTMNIEKCHAYLEIIVPSSDGMYYVYDFGKFARHFPYGVVDEMRMFTITTPATVAYPDENIYHTTRQQVGYAFELNHYEGLMLMDEMRQDIERARAGNMIFQVEAENCGHWIQTHLEELLGKEKVPNLFRAKLIRSEAHGALGGFLNFVRMMPSFFHTPMLMLFHYPFAPWRGQYITDRNGERVFKSLRRSTFWKDIIVYMPALLHLQYERGYMAPNMPYDELEEAVEKTNSNIQLVDKIKAQTKNIKGEKKHSST